MPVTVNTRPMDGRSTPPRAQFLVCHATVLRHLRYSAASRASISVKGDADVLAGLIDEPHRGRVRHRARPLSGGAPNRRVSRPGCGAPRSGHPLTTHSDGEEDTMTETQPGREPEQGAGPENEIREQVEDGMGYADPSAQIGLGTRERRTT